MGRTISGGNFITNNLFLLITACAYMLAALSPAWGLGWDSPALTVWSSFVLALLVIGTLRLLSPTRRFPRTDFAFLLPLLISINLFSNLLGQGQDILRPLGYLVIALCALYYTTGFNLAVAGLIFALEGLNLLFTPGAAGVESSVSLAVFGASLIGAALVLGRLLKSERKKTERVVREVKRIKEGAQGLGQGYSDESAVKSISPESRTSSLIETAEMLDRALMNLLDTARTAIPAGRALMFMADSEGEGVYLRVQAGGTRTLDCPNIPFGKGLVGWTAKEKKPLLVRENAHDTGYPVGDNEANSFLAVPVMNGGILEGVIALDSDQSAAFDERDRESLVRFGILCVYILQNAREYHHADRAAKNFAALHKISSEISSSLDLKTILEKLADLSSDIIPYDYLTISFIDPDGRAKFNVLRGYGSLQTIPEAVSLDGFLLGWIVENRQQLFFSDVDKRMDNVPIFPVKELRTTCRSFLGIPFINRDKVFGLLTLAMRQPDSISAYQQHMVSIVCNQVAVNIANAGLHSAMQKMATTDGLTGLINHRHFQEKADETFARAERYPEPLSILLFDIDHFKKVNDTYGHPLGDKVLNTVGAVLKETVRAVDIAARYGGEEFIVLLVNTDEKGARKMAERIRSSMQKKDFTFGTTKIPVTVSVGHSSFPTDGTSKKDLIEKADQALYSAKAGGRNRCCAFSESVRVPVPEKG